MVKSPYIEKSVHSEQMTIEYDFGNLTPEDMPLFKIHRLLFHYIDCVSNDK